MSDIKDPRGIDDQNRLIQRVQKSGGTADAPKKNVPDDPSAFKKSLGRKGGRQSGQEKKTGKQGSLFDLAGSMTSTKAVGEKQGGSKSSSPLGEAGLAAAAQGKSAAGKALARAQASDTLDAVEGNVTKAAIGKQVKQAAEEIDATEQAALLANEAAAVAGAQSSQQGSDIGVLQGAKAPAGKPDVNMKEIARQITDQIIVETKGDLTNTTVTLKHPPLFEGATIKLTEHGSAKGEFNVNFANLNAQAKALIDNPVNQAVLRDAVEVRGIPLHMITSTTAPETQVAAGDAREEARQYQEDQGGFQEGSSQHQGDEAEQEEFPV